MSNSLEQQAETIIGRMLELPEGDRADAAAQACGQNGELLRRVMELLWAAEHTGGFMDATAGPPGAGLGSSAPIGEKPGDIIGRYKLLEQIGEGGFGVVFMAEQERPVRRRVALKVIKLGMDTREVVARFEAERQALAMMDHPNIARVLDAGATDTGRPYFAMELVRGSPVTEYADKHKLSTRERIAIAAQICRAVQHAHSKGVIHRDIKPSNVLVTVADDKPVPKVIDFGIAKATQAKLTDRTLFTSHRQLIGTPQYMSPEQADSDGSDIDTRTDVYSLGVLVYELLVGTTPLDAKSLRSAAYEAMRKMIYETEPPRLTTRLSGLGDTLATVATNRSTDPKHLSRQLHGELEWIVMRALEKDRSRRYDTAAALADDLGRYLSGEAVLAGPVSGVYRLRKTLKRYKAAAVIGAVIAACLLLGVAGTTLGLVREAKQRKIADAQRADAVSQRAEADRQRIVATDEKASAVTARSQAETAATNAGRAAALSDARYLIQQGQLPEATDQLRKAEALGSRYEDGLAGRDLVLKSRDYWFLARRLNPFGHRPGVACMTHTDAGEIYLVAADEQHLIGSVTDIGTAGSTDRLDADIKPKLLVSTVTDHAPTANGKHPRPDPGTLVAVDGLEVRAYAVSPLRQLAARRFASPIVTLSTSATSALLLQEDGTLRLVDARTLVDRQTWDTDKFPANVDATPRTGSAVSPDDRFIALRSGAWTNPVVVIDRTNNKVFAKEVPTGNFLGVSPQRPTVLVSWYAIDAVVGETSVRGYDMSNDLSPVINWTVPGGETKLRQSVWAGADGSLTAIGSIGLAVQFPNSTETTARYTTLWPYAETHPRFLATDPGTRQVALATDAGDILMFQPGNTEGKVRLYEGISCMTRAGVLTTNSPYGKNDPRYVGWTIYGYPFDARQPAWSIPIQTAVSDDPKKGVYPHGTAATPDGSRVVILAQESIGGAVISSTYLRKIVVVYEPGSATLTGVRPVDGRDPWRIVRQFDLSGAVGLSPFNNRAFRLSTDGKRVIYTTRFGDVFVGDCDTGKMLYTWKLGANCEVSPDGRWVAGVIEKSQEVTVYRTSDGGVERTLPGEANGYAGGCFTDDGRLFVLSRGRSQIAGFDVTGTAGERWRHDSRLIPRAWSASCNRFIGLLIDTDDDNSGITGTGQFVLGDCADGRELAVLTATGTNNLPVGFGLDGAAIFLQSARREVKIIRPMSVADVDQTLQTPVVPDRPQTVPGPATTVPLLPSPTTGIASTEVELDATDAKGIAAHLGSAVVIHGTIANVDLPNGNESYAFVTFNGVEKAGFILFVPAKTVQRFSSTRGNSFLVGLKGREVTVRGEVTRYNNSSTGETKIEIVITKLAQLTVLTATP